MKTLIKGFGIWLLGAGILVLCARQAALADTILYASSLEGNQIVSVDINTNQVTTITNTSQFNSGPDSLIFNGNEIVYTLFSSGQLGEFNPADNSNTILASGFSQPRDLTLEPGGESVLVSDSAGNTIYRVNLSTGVKKPLLTGASPQGLTYDSKGDLFAVLGDAIDQINPITGAIMKSTGPIGSLDGLTFNSFTGELWASSGNATIYEVPTSLSDETAFTPPGLPQILDGIEGDTFGNLFIASRSDYHMYEYNITSGILSQGTYVYGLDDIAPVTGLGSQSPEAGSLLLFGWGLVGLAILRWRKPFA